MTAAEDEALARALCVVEGIDPDRRYGEADKPWWTLFLPAVAAVRAAGWAPTAALDARVIEAGIESREIRDELHAKVDRLTFERDHAFKTRDTMANRYGAEAKERAELQTELARLRTVDDAAVERAWEAFCDIDHQDMRAALLAAQQGDGE